MDASSGGNLAWAVRLSDGETFFLPISGTENGRHFAWAVRSGQKNYANAFYPENVWKTGQTVSYSTGDDGDNQRGVSWPSPRFTDPGDETVIDNLTGLIWLKDSSCMTSQYPEFDQDLDAGDGGVTWPRALEFVNGINSGIYSNCSAGYNDWRLPNRKELHSLIDYSQFGSAIPPSAPFTGSGGPSTYWTSTSSATVTDTAWAINMASGVVTAGLKQGEIIQRSHFNAVIPVRGSGESVANCTAASIDLVQKAYIAYYGRPADPAGINFWACQLDQLGGNLSEIIQSFGVSDEFNQVYGSLGHSELIDTLYQQMFNRDPDPGGKSFYLGVLERGERSLQSITLDVLFGAQNNDLLIIENKLDATKYFTMRVVETGASYDQTNLNQIKDIISGVNHTNESLTNAIQLIDNFTSNN